MKKTLIAVPVTRNGIRKLSCTYICTWLTNPTERMIDISTIGWGTGQGSFDYAESYEAIYSYIDNVVWYTPDPNSNSYTRHESTEGCENNLSSNMRNTAGENGLSCKATLKSDYEDIIGTRIYYHTYTNHSVTMNFYLTNINNTSYTYLHGQYFHQKVTGNFTFNGISVSFNALSGTASISISGNYNWSSYYTQIGDTALLNHTY